MAQDDSNSETQVVMARTVAARWISRVAQPEYRMRVMYGASEYRNLPNLLRAFRNGKVNIQGLSPMPDLGVKEAFDALEVWSSDHEAMRILSKWAEKRGFETSGVW